MYRTVAESHAVFSKGLAGVLYLRECVHQGMATSVCDLGSYNRIFDPQTLIWNVRGKLRNQNRNAHFYSAGRLFDLEKNEIVSDLLLAKGSLAFHTQNLEFHLQKAKGQHFDLDLIIVQDVPRGPSGGGEPLPWAA